MKSAFNFYYIKYKKQIVPATLFALSFFIIFRIITPQFSTISESNQIIDEKKRENEVLKETLNTIATLDGSQVSENLSTTVKALPREKDIAAIFSALTSAAASSQTQLREFSLKIGGLYGRAAKGSPVRGIPAVDVVARVTASNPKNFVEFARALQRTLPLSELKSVDINQSLGTYELGFYYKPLDLTLVAKQDKVVPLSQSDLNLINQLREWDR